MRNIFRTMRNIFRTMRNIFRIMRNIFRIKQNIYAEYFPHHAEYFPHHAEYIPYPYDAEPIPHDAEPFPLSAGIYAEKCSNTPLQCGIPHLNSAGSGVLEQIFRIVRNSASLDCMRNGLRFLRKSNGKISAHNILLSFFFKFDFRIVRKCRSNTPHENFRTKHAENGVLCGESRYGPPPPFNKTLVLQFVLSHFLGILTMKVNGQWVPCVCN